MPSENTWTLSSARQNVEAVASIMAGNKGIWDNACETIKNIVKNKQAYLWLENPDGSTCVIKVGTKLLTEDGNVFEITEDTEMETAEVATFI